MEAAPEELGPMRSGSDSSGFWLVRPVRAWSWNTYQRWKETYQSRDEQRFSASQKKGKDVFREVGAEAELHRIFIKRGEESLLVLKTSWGKKSKSNLKPN
jgi:hypothetical protein